TGPAATVVGVAGSFNNWCVDSHLLHLTSPGHWRKETTLAPGTYEYCLVVDGQWMADPLALQSVPNPYGGRNSILRVAPALEAAHLADAQTLPLKSVNPSEGSQGMRERTQTNGRKLDKAGRGSTAPLRT
ncbi:MAG: glycogen-binding domain-containing protein, partial [Verrucomicrobiales bacterium]